MMNALNAHNAYVRADLTVEPEGEGSLSGLTFAVKDVFDVAGHTSSAGNPDWRRTHGPAKRHARAVRLLLKQGARLRGATITDELMYSLQGENHHYGTPVNPRASGRVPGGSSSGSAVAVAAGDADFALGTDTGGSVRIPASYCGVYGFRPGHGAVSAEGVIPLAPSFDTVGWMSRDAETLLRVGRILLENGIESDSESESESGSGAACRLYLPSEAWELAEPGVRQALLRELASIAPGMKPESAELPEGSLEAWARTFRTIQGIEIWEQHGPWVRSEKPVFGPGIAERFQWASRLPSSDKERLYGMKRTVGRKLDEWLGSDSLLVVPTATGEAPLLRMTGEQTELQRSRTMMLTCIAGLSGLPQATVPVFSGRGNPLGLSFIAGRGRDLSLLRWVRDKLAVREGGGR